MRVTFSVCQLASKMLKWQQLLVLQVIICVCSRVDSVDRSDFFPYGSRTDDQFLPAVDNATSGEIKLAVPLTLYDTRYISVWVSD